MSLPRSRLELGLGLGLALAGAASSSGSCAYVDARLEDGRGGVREVKVDDAGVDGDVVDGAVVELGDMTGTWLLAWLRSNSQMLGNFSFLIFTSSGGPGKARFPIADFYLSQLRANFRFAANTPSSSQSQLICRCRSSVRAPVVHPSVRQSPMSPPARPPFRPIWISPPAKIHRTPASFTNQLHLPWCSMKF